MLACVDSLAVLGVDAYVVRVEVDVSSNFQSSEVRRGNPRFQARGRSPVRLEKPEPPLSKIVKYRR